MVKERDKAEQELKQQTVQLALMMSSKILNEVIDEEKHRQLIDEFISKVGIQYMYEFLDRRYALAIYEIAQSKNAVDRYIEDLKDIFEACMMFDVEYLVLAVRNVYRSHADFEIIHTFLETMYISNRIKLPLKGILLIGY